MLTKDQTMNHGTKECPVCHALCFSDMDVCYGCLHRFVDDATEGREQISSMQCEKSELPTMILNEESKEHSGSRFACVQGDSCDSVDVCRDEDPMKKDTEAFEVIKTLPFSSDQCLKFQIDVKITGV